MRRTQKPYSLRLPPELTTRVDACAERLRAAGLDVSRSDVVRMLIVRALDVIGSDPQTLLAADAAVPQRQP